MLVSREDISESLESLSLCPYRLWTRGRPSVSPQRCLDVFK
jgi:hypothetical protein